MICTDLQVADYVLKPMRVECISDAITRATAKRDFEAPRERMLRELQGSELLNVKLSSGKPRGVRNACS